MLGVDDVAGQPLVVHVEQAGARPGCVGCGAVPVVKDREVVEPIFRTRGRTRAGCIGARSAGYAPTLSAR